MTYNQAQPVAWGKRHQQFRTCGVGKDGECERGYPYDILAIEAAKCAALKIYPKQEVDSEKLTQ